MKEKPPNSSEELDALAHVVAQQYGEYRRASEALVKRVRPESMGGWKQRRRQANAMVNLLAASSEYDQILLRLNYEAGLEEQEND